MRRRRPLGIGIIALVVALVVALPAVAQTTGPTFNAPYRAFDRHEFGGTLAFPDGGGTIVEGQFRFGYRTFDIGLRGGIAFPDGPGDESLLLGVEARNRVITHSETFPVDGAVVFGVGANVNGGTNWNLPIGISLGRRLEVEGSQVSIVPYVQPTGFLLIPDVGDAEFEIGVGLGADFRLSRVFDARVSVGVGNGPEGVSVSAVWVH